MTDKKLKVIEKTAQELLDFLGVEAKLSVSEKDGAVEVDLATDDSAIVIGRHGDILESLQLILSLCVESALKEYVTISLEIGEYKKNRTEWLRNMAEKTRDEVLSSDKKVVLHSLKPWERRVIHLFLKDDEKVTSESEGEGRERVLVVKPKS